MAKQFPSTARTAEYRRRRKEAGLVQLTMWVPPDRVDGLRALVSDLIEFPEMVLIGVKEDGSGVQGGHPPAEASYFAPVEPSLPFGSRCTPGVLSAALLASDSIFSARASVPKGNTDDVPKGNTDPVPKRNTGHVPKRNTSSVPKRNTPR